MDWFLLLVFDVSFNIEVQIKSLIKSAFFMPLHCIQDKENKTRANSIFFVFCTQFILLDTIRFYKKNEF